MKENRTLLDAEPGKTYRISQVDTNDEEMEKFLLRLGCYPGEPVTVVTKKRKSCVAVIKNSRYSMDNNLARAIVL